MPSDNRSLWSDGPDEDDHHPWLDGADTPPSAADDAATREHRPPTGEARRYPPPGGEPPRGNGPRRGLVIGLAALCGVALLASGVAIGTQVIDTRTVERTLVSGGGGGGGAIRAAYEATHDGVVRVSTSSGNGTGWVYDDRGTIVTNNHVVSGAGNSIKVRFGDRGEDVPAKLLGTDVSSDLAVLRVDPKSVKKLVPLPLADSDKVQTGDSVIAIGYPLGLDQTVTAGIISGLGRQISAQNNFSIDKVLQTDAPINPGNSGGPLLDLKGRVVGVNSQIATTGAGGGSVGIGFAIPSNTVRSAVPRLENGKSVQHAYLGVQMGDSPGIKGAVVGVVTPGGPAARAGLKAVSPSFKAGDTPNGDVITQIDDQVIERADDVTRAINDHKPGDTIKVQVQRNGQKKTVDVTLTDRPTNVGSTTTVPDPKTPTTPQSPQTPQTPQTPDPLSPDQTP